MKTVSSETHKLRNWIPKTVCPRAFKCARQTAQTVARQQKKDVSHTLSFNNRTVSQTQSSSDKWDKHEVLPQGLAGQGAVPVAFEETGT